MKYKIRIFNNDETRIKCDYSPMDAKSAIATIQECEVEERRNKFKEFLSAPYCGSFNGKSYEDGFKEGFAEGYERGRK